LTPRVVVLHLGASVFSDETWGGFASSNESPRKHERYDEAAMLVFQGKLLQYNHLADRKQR